MPRGGGNGQRKTHRVFFNISHFLLVQCKNFLPALGFLCNFKSWPGIRFRSSSGSSGSRLTCHVDGLDRFIVDFDCRVHAHRTNSPGFLRRRMHKYLYGHAEIWCSRQKLWFGLLVIIHWGPSMSMITFGKSHKQNRQVLPPYHSRRLLLKIMAMLHPQQKMIQFLRFQQKSWAGC